MLAAKVTYAQSFMQEIAGSSTQLSDALSDIFVHILSRQIEEDEQGNLQPKYAFDMIDQAYDAARSEALVGRDFRHDQ